MKVLESIEINATVQGRIWMPAILCEMNVSETFKPAPSGPWSSDWTGLRDALLKVTNQGDFQSCWIVDATMVVTWFNKSNRTRIVKYAELTPTKETDDLFGEYEFEEA